MLCDCPESERKLEVRRDCEREKHTMKATPGGSSSCSEGKKAGPVVSFSWFARDRQ